MPAKYRYKTEEAYQLELKKVRDSNRAAAEKLIGIVYVKAKGALPELTEEEEGWCHLRKVDLRSKKADKVAAEIRRSLLRSWHRDFSGNCIICVDHLINLKKKVTYYTIEMTCYGAVLKKDWLKDRLRDIGLEISGYQTKRDLVVNSPL